MAALPTPTAIEPALSGPRQGQDAAAGLQHHTGQLPTDMKGSDVAPGLKTVPPQLHRAKVKRSELILFTNQLSVMLDSGVVLSDALDAIAEQGEHGAFKLILMNVAEAVKGGEFFSKSLADYPRAFNSMFISMVKASEASGKMAEIA